MAADAGLESEKRLLDNLEPLIASTQERYRNKAFSIVESCDLKTAEEEVNDLLKIVDDAVLRLQKAAEATLTLRRDLGQATDRSLVLRAETFAQNEAEETPHEELVVAAKAHLRQCLCHTEGGKPWPLVATEARDLGVYGTGIKLYFGLSFTLVKFLLFCAIIYAPVVSMNLSGSGLADVVITGEIGFLAKSTIANLVSATKTVNIGCYEFPAGDYGFINGCFDAGMGALLFMLTFYYQKKTVVAAVTEETFQVVTPDNYTVFVSHLPRQLEGELHKQYEERLQAHFESMLSARLNPAGVRSGLKVIAAKEQTPDWEPIKRSFCERYCSCKEATYDKLDRRLGKVINAPGQDNTVKVAWPPGRDGLEPGEVTYDVQDNDLKDAELLHRLEYWNVGPPDGGRRKPAVYKVSLVRDYKGRLARMKNSVRRAQESLAADRKGKKGELDISEQAPLASNAEVIQGDSSKTIALSGLSAKIEADAALRHLRELNVQDLEVIGAYVTFSSTDLRNFVYTEYRFSRLGFIGHRIQDARKRFFGKGIRVSDAPLPSDIYWENVDAPPLIRLLRQAMIPFAFFILVLVMALCLGYAKQQRERATNLTNVDCSLTANAENPICSAGCNNIGLASVLQDDPKGIRETCKDWLALQLEANGISIGAACGAALLNVLAPSVISALAEFAKPESVASRDMSVMQMIMVAKTLTLGVIVWLINLKLDVHFLGEGILGLFGAGKYPIMDTEWHAVVGVEIIMLLLFSTINPIFELSAIAIFNLKTYCCERRKKTFPELKELYTPPEFNLATAHAEQLSQIFACVIWTSCLPVMTWILLIRLLLMYCVDKYKLLRGCHHPHRHSHHMVNTVLRFLEVVAFIHGVVGFQIYNDANLIPPPEEGPDNQAFSTVMGQLSKVIDLQIAAVPNFIFLCVILLRWSFNLVSFMFGEETITNLSESFMDMMPRCCQGSASPQQRSAVGRASVLDETFEGRPLQAMIRRKINPSYELWDAEGFEFMAAAADGNGADFLNYGAKEKFKRLQDAARGLTGKAEEPAGLKNLAKVADQAIEAEKVEGSPDESATPKARKSLGSGRKSGKKSTRSSVKPVEEGSESLNEAAAPVADEADPQWAAARKGTEEAQGLELPDIQVGTKLGKPVEDTE